MMTYKEVLEEYEGLVTEFAKKSLPSAKRRKIKLKYNRLKPFLLILQTNPREEFIRRQFDEQMHKLKVLEERYPEWAKNNRAKIDGNPAKVYKAEVGINDIKKRIKILNAILR